jgi:mono/diheme cytochrome c family protein
MKFLVIYLSVLVSSLGATVLVSKNITTKPVWCWPRDWHIFAKTKPHASGNEFVPYGSYGSEVDWNSPEKIIPLDYDQAQGKRIFYQQCVWCHADSTPAGPSNRSNVTPDPPLMNDGKILNDQSDESLRKIITLGGSGAGKSAMMPPYGLSLTPNDINDLIAYTRAIAVPEYRTQPHSFKWIWRSKSR